MRTPGELVTRQDRQRFIAEVQVEAARLQAEGRVPAPPPDPVAADLPTAQAGRLAKNAKHKPCGACHQVHEYLTQDCVPMLLINTDPLALALAPDWPLVSAPANLIVVEINMSTGEQRTAVTRDHTTGGQQ